MVKLTRFDDPAPFYDRVESFLAAREAEHNLMLGLKPALLRGGLFDPPIYLACVEDGGETVAVALRTPPNNLLLSEMVDDRPVAEIVRDVHTVYGASLVGVIAPKALARSFAERWSQMTGSPSRLKMCQRIFRLERVRPVTGVPGAMRRATDADRDLLRRWTTAFMEEALGSVDAAQVDRGVNNALASDPAERGRWLWIDDGQPVCMVGYAGPTPNGIRVAPVYTPPALRGRGYASACTAAVSQWLLDQGRRFVFLYTDLNNPTSNHIYQQIGYEAVSDVDEYVFGES